MSHAQQLSAFCGIVMILGAPAVGHTQDGPTPPTYLRIDDQLIDITDQTITDGQIRRKPEGATVDSRGFAWRTKFQGWDFGVLPIQFSAEVTASQRDFFMQACTDWGRDA